MAQEPDISARAVALGIALSICCIGIGVAIIRPEVYVSPYSNDLSEKLDNIEDAVVSIHSNRTLEIVGWIVIGLLCVIVSQIASLAGRARPKKQVDDPIFTEPPKPPPEPPKPMPRATQIYPDME